MYPAGSNKSELKNAYDFSSDENAPKWKGLVVKSLAQVQEQVHPTLKAQHSALEYIEDLILRLLAILCAAQPHSTQDVADRVKAAFPHPIDRWATMEAANATDKSKKKSPLVLPVDKIHPLLTKELLGYKLDMQVTVYVVAVLEYIAADILKLTGNYVRNIKHKEISCQDIKVAMYADKVLMDMFFQDEDAAVSLNMEEDFPYVSGEAMSYEEIVKQLVLEETQYVRDLNMIIKVFRAPFAKLFPRSKDLEVIFSNIEDVQEFTVNLISSLEDALEMAEDTPPLVGGIFEELAEGAEFDVYDKYAEDILNPYGRVRLETLLQRNDTIMTFQSQGHGFKDAVKYVLPKLLLGPIYHCFTYFDIIKALIAVSEDSKDEESLVQANGVLHQLRVQIEDKLTKCKAKRKPCDLFLRYRGRGDRQAALNKMNELQKSIDSWEGKDIAQSCNKFILEGTLFKVTGRRWSERYVFLFDSLLILTKQNTKRSSVSGPMGEYKFKEKIPMRRVEYVIDKEDGEGQGDLKYAFELAIREHPSLLLACKTAEDKNNWMAALVSLLTKSMLERMLDTILTDEERQQPLRMPDKETYRFAVEDSADNIVFEENQNPISESPLIKGGTLLKLVERLTYHMYADPTFVRTFLTTYRSFCKPVELLDLLIERFEIKDPPPLVPNESGDMDMATLVREDLKRFRNEYCKPVQIRVLNVIRHWVDQHWYDFDWNRDLLVRLRIFLETVKGKAMKKYVESIHKAIARRLDSAGTERQITFEKQPPCIEWHLTQNMEDYDLMTLHPIEIARQVTLLEFDLYRAVKPSELVGTVWIKSEKNITSPNLLNVVHHSNMFTFWMERCILEAENIDERVAVMARIMEIMLVFQELNNFNGVLEVVSAIRSAPIYRLKHTLEIIETEHKYHKLKRAFDEAKELNSDHFKHYIERLRSINPPCVPFLGMYLTNILLTEEGNPDFLPHCPEGIINFSKRRKVAEITQEIQQYQNQPYCLLVENTIRAFFENLDPLEGMTEREFNDFLYSKSLDIEPRNSKFPKKAERKRDYSLKSPGIKPMQSRHSSATLRGDKATPSLTTAPNTPTLSHISKDSDLETVSTSCGATPPTPSTPLTPPPHDTSDSSVFAPVFLGSGTSAASTPPVRPSYPDVPPPPLPPRPKRESSYGYLELSPVRKAPDVPLLPPRDGERPSGSDAPPLPPRRTTDSSLSHVFTLPRTQSMTLARVPVSNASMTLPRRNSERDAPPPLNINGERAGSVTPELPPKTYRMTHSRKQSS